MRAMAAAFAALALMVTMARAADVERTLLPSLQSARADQEVDVIVQYKVTPTEKHQKRAEAPGGRLQGRMEHVKAAHYRISAAQLKALAGDPDVAYVSSNRPLKGALNITAALADTTVISAGSGASSPPAAYTASTGNVTLQGIGATRVFRGTTAVWDESTTWSAQSTDIGVLGEP
jgi:hypothetical protein